MPRDSSAFSLLDVLSETGFQASVITTYCCYFPFYEEVVLRRLLDKGCTNNILLVDAARCAEAFASEDTRPRRAGHDYTLLPIHIRGAFHPKLILTIGKSKGALFVGSHNMTLAGFGLNDEITNEFRTAGSAPRQGAEAIRAALDYLEFFIPKTLTDVGRVFDAVRRNIPWLHGPVAVPSNDRFLMTTTGRDEALWGRLLPLIPKRPSMTFICGPFFDKQLGFLQTLIDDVKPRKLVIGIDPESVEIDSAAVRKFRGAQFVNIAGLPQIPNRRESAARYLHAKVLWFTGSDGELVVTGSANPSAPAFLSKDGERNAEAIVVDRRAGIAKVLGLDVLAAAPSVAAQDWDRLAERQRTQGQDKTARSGTLVLAVPADDGFFLERPIGKSISLEAFAADGISIGYAVTSADAQSVVLAPSNIRETAQILRTDRAQDRSVMVLVHRPDEVARNVGGDRQRELRQALGALEEDPRQLEMLLKLTEKVIFDSEDIVSSEPQIRRQSPSSAGEPPKSGPESLAVNAIGRRPTKKKRLASGDILVLLDALMYRLGAGIPGPASSDPSDSESQPGDEEEGKATDPLQRPPYEILAEMCRRKVSRLIRRMARQLELASSGSARRAIVQLAAVLTVVHTLRTMEQRVEWRSKHLKLIDPDDEWYLFDEGGLALGWGSSALGPRSLKEGADEMFQELSLASGLLAWLAWDLEIDVRAEVERTTPINRAEEDDPWYPVQVFATVATHIAGDQEAQETLTGAVGRTARKGVDAASWLSTHLALADRLAKVIAKPQFYPRAERPARPGDLVILGSALDPRVRVALDVAPSGTTGKISVFDQNSEDRERQFLATHVNFIAWWEKQTAPRRFAEG